MIGTRYFLIGAGLLLSSCSSGLPISKYSAKDIMKAGGSITVSASDMGKHTLVELAKSAQENNVQLKVVDAGDMSKYSMVDISKAAPGHVSFEN